MNINYILVSFSSFYLNFTSEQNNLDSYLCDCIWKRYVFRNTTFNYSITKNNSELKKCFIIKIVYTDMLVLS